MALLTDHPRYSDLLSALDSGGAWRALGDIGDEYWTVLSASDLAAAERRPSPARFLLERVSALFDQPLTVDETLMILEDLGGPAADAAEVLRPPLPLRVTRLEETNSTAVWVPLGGRLSLLCEAEARPPPAFLWRRDGEPVPAEAGGCCARLALQPFNPSDAGRYSCEVRDAAGGTQHAGEVTVQLRQEPPRQTGRDVCGGSLTEDGVVSAAGDRPLRLTVRWTGWPQPELRWELNGLPLPGADGETLELCPPSAGGPGQPGPRLADGEYVCVASNAVGEVRSERLQVEVGQRPVITQHPESAQRRVPLGRPLQLRCSAFCRRPLKVVWRRSLEAGGDDILKPPACRVATERSPNGVTRSEIQLTPTEAEANQLCSVTCEFLVEGGDFENSFTQSKPAKFRIGYSAHSKMALILGNYNYKKQLPFLDEVERDVVSFHAAMRRLGFGVLVARNLSTQRARRVVEYFARVAAPEAYLVVLVAGHGFTHQHQDYLVPVDHQQSGGVHPNRCLSLLEDIERRLLRTSPSLVVMCGDMCRTMKEVPVEADGPTAGAARPPGPPPASDKVLRLFSTQIGHEAMDVSKFMRCLLQNIEREVTVQQLGVNTLQDCSGSPDANAGQFRQHPLMELSMAEQRSLHDPADNLTPLDVSISQEYPLEPVPYRLVLSWSNYGWDSVTGPELLLTVQLRDAPPEYYVSHVVPHIQGLRFEFESEDAAAAVSCWRLTGLSPAGGWLQLRPVIVVSRHPAAGPPQRFQLSEVLRLHPLTGLCDPAADGTQPAELRLDNGPAVDC